MHWDALIFFYIGSNTLRFEIFFDSLIVVINNKFLFTIQNMQCPTLNMAYICISSRRNSSDIYISVINVFNDDM